MLETGDGAALFHGLPSRELCLPNGDRLRVLLHGAHVVSWVVAGQERLYLSDASRFDGQSAVRGGIPVCFPQFNQRGPLPKHGFARNVSWQAEPAGTTGNQLSFRLVADAALHAVWPYAFEARLVLALQPGELQVALEVRNLDQVSLEFTGALHTYLAVDDVAKARVHGLGGQPEWDALTGQQSCAVDPLVFSGEFDRVYDAPGRAMTLADGDVRLRIEQSPSWGQTVVWNPGADKAAQLSDMPAEGYRRMLCVEAAQVMKPVSLLPGDMWRGWQRLGVY